MQMLNWQLLKHPMNWLVIILMLMIAGIAGHMLLHMVGKQPATSE